MIENMSKWKYKNLVKRKTTEAGLKYLLSEKNNQTKILHIVYTKLEMQEYLMSEKHNTELSKLIFKARSKMLDIKLHKRWKYTDVTCVGCNQNAESESELMNCAGFSDSESGQNEPLSYDLFYSQ